MCINVFYPCDLKIPLYGLYCSWCDCFWLAQKNQCDCLFVEMENPVCHPLSDWWSLFKHVVILSIYESDRVLKHVINVLQNWGRRSLYWIKYWLTSRYLIFSTILNSCYGIFWLLFWKENVYRIVLAVEAALVHIWEDTVGQLAWCSSMHAALQTYWLGF